MHCQVQITPTAICGSNYTTACFECTTVICERHAYPSGAAVRPLCVACAPWFARWRRDGYLPPVLRVAGVPPQVTAAAVVMAGVVLGVVAWIAMLP